MQDTIPFVGNKVRITADQDYEITWDEESYAGLDGLLVSINWQALAYNLVENSTEGAPFGVVLADTGALVRVAEVVEL